MAPSYTDRLCSVSCGKGVLSRTEICDPEKHNTCSNSGQEIIIIQECEAGVCEEIPKIKNKSASKYF